MIALPGFALAEVEIGPGGDRHACGREAARRALASLDPALRLAYDGTRPIVVDADGAARGTSVSITHGAGVALAVAGRVDGLGIDLCADDPRIATLAPRFLAAELALASEDLTACFAAKEAALKAAGVGLVDGGVLDGTAVTVVSLDPPRLSDPSLQLVLARRPEGVVAVVWR